MKKLIWIFALVLICAIAKADNFTSSQLAIFAIMQNLQLSENSMPQVQTFNVVQGETADFVTVNLAYPEMPLIHIFMRGPRGFAQRQDQSLKTLFLATGFFTGADSTLLLGDVAETVFVGFNYPYQIDEIGKDPGKLLQTFRLTPGQIALSLKWLSRQAWVNPHQLNAMGVSLGGLFLPTALHLAQEMKVTIERSIFAFTGADIKIILKNNLQGRVPDFALSVLMFSIPAVNTMNDPHLHLPYLKGSFLVIYSDQDQVIPRASSEDLYNLLPGNKSQVLLHGTHIDVDQKPLIEQTKSVVVDWLK